MGEISHGLVVKDDFLSEGEGNGITEVVIFTGQAYVKRQAKVEALGGLNRLLIEVRAFTVDEDSAQARVFGEGEIISVQYKEVPVKDAPQEEAQSLDEKKEELGRLKKVLRGEKDVINKQKMFLDSLIAYAEVEIPKEIKTEFPKTESLQPMLEFLETSYRRLGDQDCKLENRVEELDKEISLVEKKLKQSRRPKDTTRKAVEILFKSHKNQEIKMEISYVARNASWEPVYKVDVPLDQSSATLSMFSRIRQKTGENWKDVQLAVSNAVPIQGITLPDLQSWYLRLAPPAPFPPGAIPVGAVAMAGAPESVEDAIFEEEGLEDLDAIGSVESPPEAGFTRAVQKELPHAFEYQLPQRVHIDSGDGDTLLPLFNRSHGGRVLPLCRARGGHLGLSGLQRRAKQCLAIGQIERPFRWPFCGRKLACREEGG